MILFLLRTFPFLFLFSLTEYLIQTQPKAILFLNTLLHFDAYHLPDVIQRSVPAIDEIVEQLKSLDITSTELSAHVPFKERGALVLYQKGRAVVPFEGSFDAARKARQRTKVENRVLKLLVENINDEGHDGTDEAKVNWWENEQRVFQGRADSFIARMRLVQGTQVIMYIPENILFSNS